MTELNKIHGVFALTSGRGTATARTLTPNGTHLVDELLTAKTIEKPFVKSDKVINATLRFLEKQDKPSLTLHEIISTQRLAICKHLGNLSFVIRDPIDIFISRSKNSSDAEIIIPVIAQNSNCFKVLNNYLSNLPDEKWGKVKHIIDTTKIGNDLFSGVSEVILNDNVYSTPSDNNASITGIHHTFYYPSEEKNNKIRAVSSADIQKEDLSPELEQVKLLKGNAFNTRGLELTNEQNTDAHQHVRKMMKNFIKNHKDVRLYVESDNTTLGQIFEDAEFAYNNIKALAKQHNVLRTSLDE
jgi:hypothetical protein